MHLIEQVCRCIKTKEWLQLVGLNILTDLCTISLRRECGHRWPYKTFSPSVSVALWLFCALFYHTKKTEKSKDLHWGSKEMSSFCSKRMPQFRKGNGSPGLLTPTPILCNQTATSTPQLTPPQMNGRNIAPQHFWLPPLLLTLML